MNEPARVSPGSSRPLRVCIDARMAGGKVGGVAHVVVGLAAGLASLDDGEEEYLFFTVEGQDEWLTPFLKGQCRPLRIPGGSGYQKRRAIEAFAPKLASAAVRMRDRLLGIQIPTSDGTIERAGVDVMHFTLMSGFRTCVRSIYNPHDLQHIHLPHFFNAHDRRRREAIDMALCGQASMIGVMSTWVKNDVETQYRIPSEKVRVIPWAPVTSHFETPSPEQCAEVRRRLALPNDFILYPAQTWPHKNHVGLIDALVRLRDRDGITVPLVASGHLNAHHPAIVDHARSVGFDSLRFVGLVDPIDLQALYAMARCVVVPTLFEAASFPVWEAFQHGVACACSNVTSLPEQAGDAALVFDPKNTDAIADAVRRLWVDASLRETLIERGRRRVAQYTWERTARIYRAHYRWIAGRQPCDEDRELIAAPPAF